MSYFLPGGSWTRTLYFDTSGADIVDVAVAINDNGIIYASWRNATGSAHGVTKFDGTLATPDVLGAFGATPIITDTSISIKVGVDDQNDALATALYKNETGISFAAIQNESATLGITAITGSQLPTAPLAEHDLRVGPNSIAMEVFVDGLGDVYANFFPNLAPDLPVLIETQSSIAGEPRVALDDSGNGMAVWIQADAANSEFFESVFAARFDGSTVTWSVPVKISTLAAAAKMPDVDFDAAGNAYAVWAQSDTGPDSIFSARYDVSSDTWEPPVSVESETQAAKEPRIAVNGVGDAMVVWIQFNGVNDVPYSANLVPLP
ncbi:MAG: hypothetical protein IID61_12240 [SAR324 cluster bacterium]|nr:hypothetical protein [SAR324 cluster bacterium]